MSDDSNLKPDPVPLPPDQSTGLGGDPEVDALLSSIERASEIDARANYRVGDNHFKLSSLAIANIAATKAANTTEESLLASIREITANPI